MQSVPMNATSATTLDDDSGFKLTTTRLVRPADTLKMNDTLKTVSEETASKPEGTSAPIKVFDNSPLKKNFNSKAELEITDKARLADYNMYWHLKEFDPLDI